MTLIFSTVGSAAVILISIAIPAMMVYAGVKWDRQKRERIHTAPQSEKLLRPPGYSLAKHLDQAIETVLWPFIVACVLCCTGGNLIKTAWTMLPLTNRSELVATAVGVAMVIIGLVFSIVAVKRMRYVDNLRLGLRGEQAVAEALQELGDCGFRSFHDLPADKDWNIDHVAISPAGVFLIETKARSKVPKRINSRGHVLQVWRNTLRFPSTFDANAIPQAERNAEWLANYLTKKTGEPVEVEALVVLPGWFVENMKPPDKAMVMNAKYMTSYLRARPERLPTAQVRRIVAAIDEKCRDLEF